MGKQAKVKDGVEKERRLFSTTALPFPVALGMDACWVCVATSASESARGRTGWVGSENEGGGMIDGRRGCRGARARLSTAR
jgi:hypothetical protein